MLKEHHDITKWAMTRSPELIHLIALKRRGNCAAKLGWGASCVALSMEFAVLDVGLLSPTLAIERMSQISALY